MTARLRRLLFAVPLVVALLAVAAWIARRPVLAAVGGALVVEDEPGSVDLIVISNTGAYGGAFEAARLFHGGFGRRIALVTWNSDPIDDAIRRLGVPLLAPNEVEKRVLALEGVPGDAVVVVPARADGTGPEVAAIVAFAREHAPESVLYITAKTHTARARWLLRRALPPGVRVGVRSPSTDTFVPQAWWHSRNQTRELVMEYLRWVNDLILRDPWSRPGWADPPGPNPSQSLSRR